jgi:serine protease AprX
MSKVHVLLEMPRRVERAFELHSYALSSASESVRQAELLLENMAGMGVEVDSEMPPVPMFSSPQEPEPLMALHAFSAPTTNEDLNSQTLVVSCAVERSRLDALRDRGVTVWANSELTLFERKRGKGARPRVQSSSSIHTFDFARSGGGVDCYPGRPGVSLEVIRELLGVERIWRDGFRGQNIVVGIVDNGVDGRTYPVVGGFSRSNAPRPGTALVTSHGSMCAADVLVAAPAARFYDYPFLGVPSSGGALTMYQAILEQRRKDGTPHLTNNSYGFVGVPPRETNPDHEIWNINHPLHRKVREVIASGAAAFFAAGNCGASCPSGVCHPNGIGPGKSIHASNALQEVITVAAVNSHHERVGYSSQGPGLFERQKPDVSGYTHFFANFGPGRPGGMAQPCDNGTSAAAPLVTGVGALLLSAFPQMTPAELKEALIRGTTNLGVPGWDADTGHGVVNAAASYSFVNRGVIQLGQREGTPGLRSVG